MANGRLIRVAKYHGDQNPIMYVVAIADAVKAMALIRAHIASSDNEVDDLGRVSDALIESLHLGSGQYKRA